MMVLCDCFNCFTDVGRILTRDLNQMYFCARSDTDLLYKSNKEILQTLDKSEKSENC